MRTLRQLQGMAGGFLRGSTPPNPIFPLLQDLENGGSGKGTFQNTLSLEIGTFQAPKDRTSVSSFEGFEIKGNCWEQQLN